MADVNSSSNSHPHPVCDFTRHAGGYEKNSEMSLPPQKKQKLDEESDGIEEEEDGDDDYHDEEMDTSEYDSDGDFKDDVWSKYRREIRESGGFDIYHYPGHSYMAARFTPMDVEKSGQTLDKVVGFSKTAIEVYNRDKNTNYKWEKVESTNMQLWGVGVNFYITFRAQDYAVGTLKSFQAKVWFDSMYNDVVVKFCRLRLPTPAT